MKRTALDAVVAPWALTLEMYGVIREIYDRHMQGEKLSLEEIQKRIGAFEEDIRPGAGNPARFQRVDRVAVIPMVGVMSKRMNWFMQISGGASTQLVSSALKEAIADESVDSILLHIDSPGGSVDGTQQLANLIFESRSIKPIHALADGSMMSGAMWVGAAASKTFISSGTDHAGSIGVVATHIDRSKQNELRGLKETEVVSGKFKRIASESGPLTKEGKEWLQDKVDYIYSVFVGDIAKFRGVSEEKVLKGMADGQIFIGQQAVDAGLVDGIKTFDEAIAELNGSKRKNAGAQAASRSNTQEEAMTLAEMKEKDPQGYAKLVQEIKAEVAPAIRAEAETEFKAKSAGLEKQLEDLTAQSKEQAKQLVIISESYKRAEAQKTAAAQKETADKIANEILEESSIPENLYPKVRSMVDHEKFVKAGEVFSPESDSGKAFSTAFKSEVSDWEAKLPKSDMPGVSEAKRDASGKASTEADIEYGRNLARAVGPIRSDEK